MILYYDFGNGDYEFETTTSETREALKDIAEEYSREELIDMIDEPEVKDYTKEELVAYIVDNLLEDCFEDDLWSYFETEASSCFEDYCEYQRDMYSYYGLRESDFH